MILKIQSLHLKEYFITFHLKSIPKDFELLSVNGLFWPSGLYHDCLPVSGLNGADGGVDEISQEEVFEEKLQEAMDLASQKSAQGRTMALESMCTAFIKKFIPDFVDNQRMTLTDIVERSMKKGKTAEQIAASRYEITQLVAIDFEIEGCSIEILTFALTSS